MALGTRSPVNSRLESLFPTPRSSLDAPRSSLDAPRASSDAPRSRPASPLQSDTSMAKSATSSIKLPATSSSIVSSLRQTPVVRWLGSTGQPTADADDAEGSDALRQAIEDEHFVHRSDSRIKLVRPPQAHIASHARPFRQPALLDELARAARPTASSPVPLSAVGSSSPTFSSQTPTIFSQHPPTRTSVDYLRSLNSRDRGISTTAVAHAPSLATPTRWWFQDGNKTEIDELLGEEDRASTAQKEAEYIRQKCPFVVTYFDSSLLTFPFRPVRTLHYSCNTDLAPKHPVVFCHGLLGFDMIQLGPAMAPLQISHWRGIKEVLEENDVEVLITRVPATSSVHDRAKVLEEKITETYPGQEVHLIGHSMASELLAEVVRVFTRDTVLDLGRPGLSVSYIPAATKGIQGPIGDDHRDPPPRLLLRRLFLGYSGKGSLTHF